MSQYLNPFYYLSRGFKIFRNNFKNIFIICFIIYFPISIVFSLVSGYLVNIDNAFDLATVLSDPTVLMNFMKTNEYGLLMFYNVLIIIINIAFVPIGTIAVARISASEYYETEYDYKEVLSASFSKVVTIAIATLLYGIAIFLGSMAFLIPGLFMLFYWYFYVYAIAIKNAKIGRSFTISGKMLKGAIFRTIVAIAVILATQMIVHNILAFPFALAGNNIFMNIIFNFLRYFISAIFTASFAVFFCDVYDEKLKFSNEYGI